MTDPSATAAGESTAPLLRRALAASPWGRLWGLDGSVAVLEVLLALVLAAATGLAAWPALHAYQVPAGGLVVVLAGAGSVLLGFASVRVLRLGPLPSYGLSLAGLVVLLLAADGPHPGEVATALAHGPNRVLTETLPLAGNRTTISALVVLAWVGGATTAEAVGRSWGRRPRAPFALAVPALLYLMCFAVAAGSPHRDTLGGPLLIVALAGAAALRAQLAIAGSGPAPVVGEDVVRPPSPGRAVLIGAAVAVAVAAATTLVASAVPDLGRRPVAVHRRPPTVVPVITDPLGVMEQVRDGAPHHAPVTELTASLAAPSDGYLAMADLDVYDGDEWQFTATFQPTGGRVPAGDLAGVVGTGLVRQDVRLNGAPPLPLLPALDRPTSVSGVDVDTDGVTGMLLPQSRTGPVGYRVVSRSPLDGLAALPPADGLDTAAGVAADRQIPADTSAYLATTVRFLTTLTAGARPSASVAYLQAVAQGLQARERRVDPTLPAPAAGGRRRSSVTTTTLAPTGTGGTSLSQVINAVTVDRAATPEQFATLFAMVARYLGVPARVVTGFRLASGSAGRPVPPGTYSVTSRQAWTWVEIPVAGLGWVVCDPTPDAVVAAGAPPPESVSAPATTVPPRQANAVPRNEITGGHALAPPARLRVPSPHPVPAWLWAVIAVVGMVLILLLAGPGQAAARRAGRRRRRRSDEPDLMAVGAWLELIDSLERAGLRLEPGSTSSEVATEVGHHFGADLVPDVARMAAVADRAIFCTSVPIHPAEAAEAWVAARDLRRRVVSGLDGRQRLRSSVLVGHAPGRPSGAGR